MIPQCIQRHKAHVQLHLCAVLFGATSAWLNVNLSLQMIIHEIKSKNTLKIILGNIFRFSCHDRRPPNKCIDVKVFFTWIYSNSTTWIYLYISEYWEMMMLCAVSWSGQKAADGKVFLHVFRSLAELHSDGFDLGVLRQRILTPAHREYWYSSWGYLHA